MTEDEGYWAKISREKWEAAERAIASGEPFFGDGREEMIAREAILKDMRELVEASLDNVFCRHPFEQLLQIRGSIMCGVCHREIDRYGSPLHQALIWWHEKKR